ncbi:MAG TPA: tetratricopeptide repeat protein [Thermoanaerobaculia bacterium]|nr:tetratricopeptide repeat protein [Thermoanaerobaculia bacterium]
MPKTLSRTALGGALALLLAAGAALAVGQGRITGVVTDGKGVPLADVKVTVTTKSLGNFKMELKTDKDGRWGTVLNDATLVYHYKFEKQGYMGVEQDKKVPIASTEELNVQLLTQDQAIEKGVVKQVLDPFVTAYNAAVEAYQAGDMDAAWTKAQDAVKLGPDKANGYDLAAKIAVRRKDWDGTIAMGEKSLALEADNPPLVGILMEAYRAKGDKAKAAEYEKKYIAANPDQPDVIYNQAVDLYNKGKFKEAEPLLLKVVEAKPDHAKAHYLLGMCDVNINKIPEMKKHLTEYLRLEPNGSDAGTAKEMLDAFK